jgi:hypothetical protein
VGLNNVIRGGSPQQSSQVGFYVGI